MRGTLLRCAGRWSRASEEGRLRGLPLAERTVHGSSVERSEKPKQSPRTLRCFATPAYGTVASPTYITSKDRERFMPLVLPNPTQP